MSLETLHPSALDQPTGATVRLPPPRQGRAPAAAERSPLDGVQATVTIIIKTLLRPSSLERCVRSIRKRFPAIPILVADDSGYRTFDDELGLITAYYLLPRDSGASYGRNFLVGQVKTPYVMVVDDDTLFDEETRLEAAWQVLETVPELDLVAGYYRPARWWGCFEVDQGSGNRSPINHHSTNHHRGVLRQVFETSRGLVAGFPVYDFVPQFYLARSSKIRQIGWDDELKTLDHLQFFWRARGRLKATVLPYFSAFNTSERNPEYDAFRWQRVPFFRRLQLRKLGLGGIEDVVRPQDLGRLAGGLDRRALEAPDRGPGRTLVIGLGTGRCGTVSLSQVLAEAFDGAPISHERPPLLPWDAAPAQVEAHLERLADAGGDVFGDVAFYYLPHVETIRGWAERRGIRARFVCLRRQRQATVQSYLAKVAPYNANHWMSHDGSRWRSVPQWDACYPKLDHCQGLDEALGAYWDLYAEHSDRLARLHPEAFRVFDLEVLNDSRRLDHLVQFVAPTGSLAKARAGVQLNSAANTHRLAAQRQHVSGLPIWYLNLDRAGDRRSHTEGQLRAVGARSWRRLPALDGQRLHDVQQGELDGVSYLNRLGANSPKADLATLLSHLQAARQMLDTPGLERICVLEDDMVFEGFEAWPGHRLADLLAAAPPDWNILQLQCNNTDVLHYLALRRTRCALVPRQDIDPVCKAWGAGAYLLSRRGAQALIRRHWRDGRWLLDGTPFLAVERLLYDIPDVYLATDCRFVANRMPSQIAAHHDAIDRAATELCQRLRSAPDGSDGGPDDGHDVRPDDGPAVIYFTSHRVTDATHQQDIDRALAARQLPPHRRVQLRALLPSDLPTDGTRRRDGEVWGVRYCNRCRRVGQRKELARVLCLLKGAFVIAGTDFPGAWILEVGGEARLLPEDLSRPHFHRKPSRSAGPAAFWLGRRSARALVEATWRRGVFVLHGERPSALAMLAETMPAERMLAGVTPAEEMPAGQVQPEERPVEARLANPESSRRGVAR